MAEIKPPRGEIVYLASPYTNHPAGRAEAVRRVARVAAILLTQRKVVYSPIVHGHHLAAAGDDVLPGSTRFWLAHCCPFLDAARIMYVFTDDGWRESRGVTYEIGYMHAQGKYVDAVDAEGNTRRLDL